MNPGTAVARLPCSDIETRARITSVSPCSNQGPVEPVSMNRQERRRAERAAAKVAQKTRRGGAGIHAAVDEAAALLDIGHLHEAEHILRAVVGADSSNIRALVLLSITLRRQERLDEAAAYARRASVRDRQSAAAQTALGEALRMQDRVFEAIECLDRAVALAPADAEAHHAYGLALIDVGDVTTAVVHLRRACELQPASMRYTNSLGIALITLGDFRGALERLDEVLQHDPENAQVRFNRSFSLLGLGRLVEGWADYEYGFRGGNRQPNRSFPVPRWRGEPLSPGQRLLVWREQGIGDEIRLASCYPDVLSRCPDVIIEAEPRLTELFRRSFPAATVRGPTCDDTGASTQAMPDYDVHIAAGSLPGIFRRHVEDFGRQSRFLVTDPNRRREFRRRLDELGPAPKVGICWRSMRLDVKRLIGYTTLQEWEPVLAVPGVTFLNLQYGHPDHLEAELIASDEATGVPIIRWDDVDYTDDVNGVAALIDELDLVVSVTTAVSALAGALGKPVLQIGVVNDPMQLGQPDRYPWFPTVQPFSRELTEGWAPTMHRVATAIRDAVTSA